MASGKDEVKNAFDQVSEAALALGCHGYKGYSVDTGALDAVFLRSLMTLRNAIGASDLYALYDPEGTIFDALPASDAFL